MNRGGLRSAAELNAGLYDLRTITWPGAIDFYRQLAAQGGPTARVLEVACGTGRVAIELARDGFDLTGVDVSREMLAVARAKVGELQTPGSCSATCGHSRLAIASTSRSSPRTPSSS